MKLGLRRRRGLADDDDVTPALPRALSSPYSAMDENPAERARSLLADLDPEKIGDEDSLPADKRRELEAKREELYAALREMRAMQKPVRKNACKIEELWVYPIKACRGCRVRSAKVVASGLELDRAWCVVDLDGVTVAACEAISQRKLPILATVKVSLGPGVLLIDAPGMPQLSVPVDGDMYADEPIVEVQASGKSTTAAAAAGDWWLGSTPARKHSAGSDWFTEYLNRDAGDADRPGVLVSGKSTPSRFGLCRCVGRGIEMSSYPPYPFPPYPKDQMSITRDAASDTRFAGNARMFPDFAPFLLVNKASADAVAALAARLPSGGGALARERTYPIGSFRGNIVVRAGEAWAEETWASVCVRPADGGGGGGDGGGGLWLKKIKECPRCTVPCRDGHSGGFLYNDDKLKLWKVLKKAFPKKFSDPEWGSWAGAFFGVYFGHGGLEGATLREGDAVDVMATTSWDAHLAAHEREARPFWEMRKSLVLMAVLLAVLSLLLAIGAAAGQRAL